MAGKSFIATFILFLLTGNAYCQFFSVLDLRMFDNSNFSISIDNQGFTAPSNRLILSNLLPGTHFILLNATPYGKWPAGTSNYFFSGLVTLPYNARVNAFVDEFRRLEVSSVTPILLLPDVRVHANQTPISHHADFYSYQKHNLLDSASFAALKLRLLEPKSSMEKLMILKMSLLPNKVNVARLSELMQSLDFDRERLEFALYAYYFCLDKENYSMLGKAFIFEGTAKELHEKTFNLY